MKNNKIKLVLILALAWLTLASLAACGGEIPESRQQVVEVSRGDIMVSVAADGNLSLIQQRQLTFGTSGTVAEISVQEGDWAAEGEELARLETTSLEQTVKSAELAVKAASIDLDLATNSYTQITYPYTYSTFAISIPESLVAMRDALRQVKTAQETLEIGLTLEQYWQVLDELDKAEDNLVEAEAKLARGYGQDVFNSGILPTTSFWTLRATELQMKKAQVALDNAENELEKAKDLLDDAVIVAPFDGIAAKVNVKEGEAISSMYFATTTVIDFIDPSRMELKADVDEIDIPGVKSGLKTVIELDALPNLLLDGEVTSVSMLATEESGLVLYEVTIGLDVPEDSGIRAGMTAAADIIIGERENVLLIPSRAITEDSSGDTVVQVLVDGQVQERAVVTGLSDGYEIEIVDGLNEGDMVLAGD